MTKRSTKKSAAPQDPARESLEARLAKAEADRVEAAKAQARDHLAKKSADWGAAQARLEKERVQEQRAAKRRKRDDEARKKAGMPNRKVKPVPATTITGERVIMDEVAGRFGVMVKTFGWPRELAAACQRFEAEYQDAMHGGVRGQSYDVRVDTSSAEGRVKHVECAMRMRALEKAMDPEEWMMLVLWAGHGVTITRMHELRIGVKDELGRLLRRAATRCASFYASRAMSVEETTRFRMMRDLVRELSAKVSG